MWPRALSRWALPITGVVLGCVLARGFALEVEGSPVQAWSFSGWAGRLAFRLEPGPSPSIRFPHSGPYDERLGHGLIPNFTGRLWTYGYAIDAQARLSPELTWLTEHGLYAGYREKTQAGLRLSDRRGGAIYGARYPARTYGSFEAVPPVIRDTLQFMEDRSLLDPEHPSRNPAVDPSRLARAMVEQAWYGLVLGQKAPGGSTLATQIEKIRHSPGGRTASVKDKLRQMTSASLRAYRDGENTLSARRQVLVDYLDSLPLLSQPGRGEIQGLGDGLEAWYGRDFDEVNALLADIGAADDRIDDAALAFKQALSLLIAQRRPARYLGGGDALLKKTDSYLRVLAEAGIIDARLRDAALALPLERLPQAAPVPVSFVARKAANSLRTELSAMLGVRELYDLDRLDLSVESTLDGRAQAAVTDRLLGFGEPVGARQAGLYGFRLLQAGDDPGQLVWSFSLFERTPGGNLLRVRTDSLDQPFDVSRGARLDLGSTAKLRTLVTYLQVVARLHERYVGLDAEDLARRAALAQDPLSRWAAEYLGKAVDRGLPAMLAAALDRRYSTNPAEGFPTGGGVQYFGNFDPRDNGRMLTVQVAFENSVNLVFVRLMRDLVRYYEADLLIEPETIIADPKDPRRLAMLARFADFEGSEFMTGFYRKYRGKSPVEAQELLLQGGRPRPIRVASVLRSLHPTAGLDEFAAAMRGQLPERSLSDAALTKLFREVAPDRVSWADRGYLAHVHPLELWLAAYLREHPAASLEEALRVSAGERQAVYGWLFKSRSKPGQDARIAQVMERDAFAAIARDWQRLGYPFAAITPSLASAIGAAGDRPESLAELLGILANGGLRLPDVSIEALRFAAETPFETRLARLPTPARRVLPEEVADAAKQAMLGVVRAGTARRLAAEGARLSIAGKTGTGDHRYVVVGRGGRVVSSSPVSRSATFLFLVGDRFYGELTVHVEGEKAAHYRFTSSLAIQAFKSLLPSLQPLFTERS